MDSDLRYSIPSDESYLRQWLLSPGMLHFFPIGEGEELENAVRCWVNFFRYSASLTALIDNQPVGMATLFLMPYRKVAHHCLFKIIVDPKYQRKGIGTQLVRNIKHLAKNYFRLEHIHTEVFDDNPLIALLKKQGFETYAIQEGFVKEGDKVFSKVLLDCDLRNL